MVHCYRDSLVTLSVVPLMKTVTILLLLRSSFTENNPHRERSLICNRAVANRSFMVWTLYESLKHYSTEFIGVFLLAFQWKQCPYLHRFWDIMGYWSKIYHFTYSPVFGALAGVIPLEFREDLWRQNRPILCSIYCIMTRWALKGSLCQYDTHLKSIHLIL